MPTIELFCNGKKLYDINKLIDLARDIPVSKIKVNELEHQLYLNTWISQNKRIRPIDVLNYNKASNNMKNIYEKNYRRIQNVSLDYPILLNEDMLIIDGLHRLSKAKKDNKVLINVKIIPAKILEKAIIDVDVKKLKLC